MKDVMINVLTKFFNKTEDEIVELIFDGDELKEDAAASLIALDESRVKRIKTDAAKDSPM